MVRLNFMMVKTGKKVVVVSSSLSMSFVFVNMYIVMEIKMRYVPKWSEKVGLQKYPDYL